MTNRTIQWPRWRGAVFCLVVALGFLAACALPPRVTGKTHVVKINIDRGNCPTSVEPPAGSCTGVPVANVPEEDEPVCVAIGEAVQWVTQPEERRFKVYLDPFGKAWTSTPWYAPGRREFTRGPTRRSELDGASLAFKYTVTVEGCKSVQLDPYIVVHY